ncbi:GTPase domain-containing protein [Candidatus Thiomargarita nelsonii]|uniref:GTPase domain-containing protein n=1 Tax=Candidatus Thiomargarita nelsonii TaxID=1003181 RepID=A0A176RWJ6_9GAMM|nr:GTPase domain-containing protein [Candidatus Thiomargarita nelsonii]
MGPFSESLAKSVIKSLLKGIATRVIVSSFIKFIPGGGTAIGTANSLVFNGASTYALGQVFIQHFESNGTLLTFDPNQVIKKFIAEFEKGKKKVNEFE